jgi:hypothetical protein
MGIGSFIVVAGLILDLSLAVIAICPKWCCGYVNLLGGPWSSTRSRFGKY